MFFRKSFLAALALAGACAGLGVAQVYQDVLVPLKSAATDGLGAFSLSHVGNRVMGTARISNPDYPDLFMIDGKGSPLLLWVPFERLTADGVPVFGQPQKIEKAPKNIAAGRCAVLQTADGEIHFLSLEPKGIVHWRYDPAMRTFARAGMVDIPKLPSAPRAIGADLNPDGSVDVYFELGKSLPRRFTGEDNNRTADWRPVDAQGSDLYGFSRAYLYTVRYEGLLSGDPQDARMVSPREEDVYFGYVRIDGVKLGEVSGALGGSRYGEILFYAMTPDGFLKHWAVGEDGIALRHPQINSTPIAFRNAKGDMEGIIGGGEGPLYFYRYTGKFNAAGAPVFKAPVPVLQSNALLTAGALATPVVVDWDGDGVLDMIAGASEGLVRFFKNIGTNEEPRFLDAVLVEADGEAIRVEGGYSGSIQGAREARWGYITPTVIDWDGDGLLDLIIGDIKGEYHVYLNRGTPTEPKLEKARPLYCDGLNLKGRWRCGAAAAKIDGRNALAIVDDEDAVHLYWQIDAYNLEDGGKLKLTDGSVITTSGQDGGGSGRTKLSFYDWDGDGELDLVIGAGRTNAIPNRKTGYPMPTLGAKPPTTILFMKNSGKGKQLVFEHPVPFLHEKLGLLQPGGAHETGVCASLLGSRDGKPSLMVCNENGRVYLIENAALRLPKKGETLPAQWKPTR